MPFIKKGILAFVIAFITLSTWALGSAAQNSAVAAEFTVDESFRVATINDSSSFFVAHKSMTYLDVLHPSSPLTSGIPLTRKNSRLWISSEIRNDGFSTIPLVLNIDRLNINDLQIYLLDGNARIIKSYRYQAGKGDFSLKKPFSAIRLSFSLTPQEDVRLVIGVYDDGLRYFPISLWEKQELKQYDETMLILLGIVLGMLTVLTGYFLLSYLYQRTPARFWLTITNFVLFALFFVAQGGLATWPSLTNASEITFACLIGLSFLMLAKVTHSLFSPIPLALRLLTFALPIAMTIAALASNAFDATRILFAASPIIAIYHLALAFIYKDKQNLASSRLFAFAWVFVFMLYAVFAKVAFDDMFYTASIIMVILTLLALSLLCLGFAVELKERNISRVKLSENEATISSLHHFYDLFRNSSEGLYTSTLEGELKTVNPAMCALFGYPNESKMLEQVKNTKQFYANIEDRDVLVGELLHSGQVSTREIKGMRSNGSAFWFSISCQVRKNDDSSFLYGSIIDVTEKKQSDSSLQFMATHDSLTGVYNRRQFETTLTAKLSEKSTIPPCILYLDLDRFKLVNDTSGHKAGDALLKDIAHLLEKSLPNEAMLARISGDEFAVIFENQPEEATYLQAVQLLNAVQAYRFSWENRIFSLGVSIGMVVCSEPNGTAEQYICMADAACYYAKDQGRNQIHKYSKDDESTLRYQDELDWVNTIQLALSEDRFLLYYQPLRPLSRPNDGHYYEVLLRLKQTDGSIIEPAAFLPTAERFEMNVKIDKWVITNTFNWLSENPEHLSKLKRCSINLNCHSLADRDFKLFVLNAFERYKIPYDKICFEMIESVAIIKMEYTIDFMRTFHRLGCSFALDDFGRGFASYGYLKHLPVDVVKIDGTFIKDMRADPVDVAMVSSIKDVAKALGMQTVGEFVESDATMTQLGNMGVDFAQGFGVAPPAPLIDFKPL
ncbi:EAL domain-containing protein [Alteromonas sp. 1_MG-2023]|uniref:EAL domain-containing protein n=1 Tax=Alteromonas sp. 1_MG-2023 TaxID=3062669 RepID=UPI0026E1D3DB|nr:EAL domain-containing protein [Alteromonas sp. 1_MG-2023]MDO6566621.1 EAL domain-containing protein [Alteromonas sp. 1_MG-2023]